MTRSPGEARSILFVPGDRPERFARAVEAGSDLVVVDLEDAVATDRKAFAREAARDFLRSGGRVAVRVNAIGTAWHDDDVDAVGTLASAVMVPKARAGDAFTRLAGRLAADAVDVLALVETADAVLDARVIAQTQGVSRLAFGSFDLAAELGVDPADGYALSTARSALVLGSAAAGLPAPIDGPHGTVADDDGLRSATAQARRLGFTAKLCIHPRQVPIVEAGFAASEEELAWARQVVEAAGGSSGVSTLDGAMIDKPVLDRARRLLRADQRP